MVEIVLSDGKGIRVLEWTTAHKKLAVEANVPKDEIVLFVKRLLRKKIKKEIDYTITSIEIFDKKWPVKLAGPSGNPYIKNDIIYCFSNSHNLSYKQIDEIKERLLNTFIHDFVGKWEERLCLLVPTILFRKNKTNPFTICLTKEAITFSKSLHAFSLDVVEYCVAMAMMAYLGLHQKQQEYILNEYMPLWKIYEKNIAYEYRCNN